MGRIWIRGPQAGALLDWIVTADVASVGLGRARYTLVCTEDGGIIDDCIFYRLGDEEFLLIANAANREAVWRWLHQWRDAQFPAAELEDRTSEVGMIAFQGPHTAEMLERVAPGVAQGLGLFRCSTARVADVEALVGRTGYTGDLGYELWVSPDNALQLWDAIFAVKSRYDVHAMGLSTLEMVRIEAGFIMPGFDFNTAESTVRANFDRSPYEVGLGWVVNLDKGQFTGRQALVAESKRPATRRLTKITIDGNKPVGEAFIFSRKGGKSVGEIKCAIWSPILKANIALADIEYVGGALPQELWARIDYQRELKWMSAWAECRATDKPFYSPDHRSATPPRQF